MADSDRPRMQCCNGVPTVSTCSQVEGFMSGTASSTPLDGPALATVLQGLTSGTSTIISLNPAGTYLLPATFSAAVEGSACIQVRVP